MNTQINYPKCNVHSELMQKNSLALENECKVKLSKISKILQNRINF